MQETLNDNNLHYTNDMSTYTQIHPHSWKAFLGRMLLLGSVAAAAASVFASKRASFFTAEASLSSETGA